VDEFTPVLVHTLGDPVPAASTDGRVHLAYELQLLNSIGQPATIQGIEVFGDGESLLKLDGDDLAPWMKPFGAPFGERTITAGQGALIWLDVVVGSLDDVPAKLTHELTIGYEEENLPIITSTMVEHVVPIAVTDRTPIVIGPPLEGPNWLDGNSCCEIDPHRTAVNPVNGSLHVPERFAIDYVQLDASGRVFDGPVDELSSYAYYGANILAVGDGPIVSMRWDLQEQKPGANPTGLAFDEYGGNHIVQDLGNGHYAFYAHLQPGNAMNVEVGQVLQRGDVIALLGNTGNTDSPHLHFHVMDSPSPLASNGLPFLIDSFDYVGKAPSQEQMYGEIAAGDPITVDTTGAGARKNQSPLVTDVMNYPGP
jgi:hypothetical protein